MASATQKTITPPVLVTISTSADPTFTKIEAHRAAKRAYAATCDYDDRFPPEVTRAPRVMDGMYNDGQGNRTPRYLHSPDEIAESLRQHRQAAGNTKFLQGKRAARKRLLLAGLRADAAALKKVQDEMGYTAALEAFKAATKAEEMAYDALLRTIPATPAGLAALLAYVAENEIDWLDRGADAPCFRALKMAAEWLQSR